MPKFQELKGANTSAMTAQCAAPPHWRLIGRCTATHVTPLEQKGRCTAGPYPRRWQYAVVTPAATGIHRKTPANDRKPPLHQP